MSGDGEVALAIHAPNNINIESVTKNEINHISMTGERVCMGRREGCYFIIISILEQNGAHEHKIWGIYWKDTEGSQTLGRAGLESGWELRGL